MEAFLVASLTAMMTSPWAFSSPLAWTLVRIPCLSLRLNVSLGERKIRARFFFILFVMRRFNSKLPPSEVEASWRAHGVLIGVDEAGRGPVLGPMVYGAAFWNLNSNPEIAKQRAEHKFDDSKKLTEESRDSLYEFICRPEVPIGFFTCELSAELLSEQMQQCPTPVSLNKIAWDCTVELIQKVVLLGYPVRG